MIKVIKTFFIILFILFILYFLHLNDSRVNVNLIYKNFKLIPVSIIILGSIGVGVISGYLFAVFSIFSMKSKMRKIENKNSILNKELNNLRNIAVDEGVLSEDID